MPGVAPDGVVVRTAQQLLGPAFLHENGAQYAAACGVAAARAFARAAVYALAHDASY
jgi:hypothetical protein